MDSALEPGYLARLFSEPVYLMGYETKKETISVITEIQQETVVVKPEIKKIPVTPTLTKIQEKENRKCILLYESEEDELSAGEKAFLLAIMNACKVSHGEYECINFKGLTITDIATRYTYNKLILFGVTIPGLPIGQYKNTLVKSTQIISSDHLWMLESNKGLKSQLWNQLQIMFGLIK